MDLKAKKSFSSPYTGNVTAGDILRNVSEHAAVQFMDYGLCEPLQDENRPLADGPAKPSLSSQAGQVSPSNSASTSASDTPQDSAEQSRSTPRSSAPRGSTQSTDSTGRGGSDTTKKPRGRPRKSPETGGRRKPSA